MEMPLRFPGQYADKETGWFHNHWRTYSPREGRYLQADPIGLAGGANRFGYVGGNPVSRTDPLGLDWFRRRESNEEYAVGRRGNPFVPPGGLISRAIEQCVPAGRTFGVIHDAGVEELTSRGVPDWLANVPTMPGAYREAVREEVGNSLLNIEREVRDLYRR